MQRKRMQISTDIHIDIHRHTYRCEIDLLCRCKIDLLYRCKLDLSYLEIDATQEHHQRILPLTKRFKSRAACCHFHQCLHKHPRDHSSLSYIYFIYIYIRMYLYMTPISSTRPAFRVTTPIFHASSPFSLFLSQPKLSVRQLSLSVHTYESGGVQRPFD